MDDFKLVYFIIFCILGCFLVFLLFKNVAREKSLIFYANSIIILMQEFNLSILEECIALGAQRTMALLRRHRDYGTNMQDSGLSDSSSGETERTLDPLLQAAQLTLFRLINNVINTLPVPHRIMSYSNTTMAGHEEQYHDKMEDLFTDSGWFDTVFHLASALLQYLVSLSMFPWEGNVPEESTKDVGRFIVLCAEVGQVMR